jgi:hypothetical protein
MADEIHDDDLPAEPIELRRFDMHSAWRITLWGATAAMAVAIVAGTAFSDIGAERLKQTVAALWPPSKPDTLERHEPAVTPGQFAALEQQTRELTRTVRQLAADRDRVNAKLASVEQNLGDITGTIKKQAAQVDQFAGQLASQLAAHTAPQAPTAPPPAVSSPQTVAAISSPPADPATAAPDTPVITATTPPAIEASPPIEGPVPLPPMRAAALENAATVRELGVDVGGATSLEALHAHWASLKANAGPDIVGLAPSFAVRPRPSGGSDYRLVLGPLPNTVAALRLCAKLIAARVNCRTGTFSVQRLANAAAVPAVRSTQHLPSTLHDSIMSR